MRKPAKFVLSCAVATLIALPGCSGVGGPKPNASTPPRGPPTTVHGSNPSTPPPGPLPPTIVHRLLQREYDLARDLSDPKADSKYAESLATLDAALSRIESDVRGLP